MRGNRGFSLIELAIVIGIVGLLLGAILVPLATQLKLSKVRDTQARLGEVREALVGYALRNGRLPCPEDPATVPTGVEGPRSGAPLVCDFPEGILPWLELNVAPDDAWGRHVYYRPGREFTASQLDNCNPGITDRLDLCDRGDALIQTRVDDPATSAVREKTLGVVVDRPAAVILSFGPNGYGARSYGGDVVPVPAGVGGDEVVNYTIEGATPELFRTRTFFETDNANCDDADDTESFCPFDDVVTWLPATTLINRMAKVGLLPP
ncbi:MAG: type II secretion system protein [Pseudomonadota bacterium]